MENETRLDLPSFLVMGENDTSPAENVTSKHKSLSGIGQWLGYIPTKKIASEEHNCFISGKSNAIDA